MGSYADSLLTRDEKVLRRERQHPIALILDSWLAIVLWAATIILIVVRLVLPRDVFGRDLFGQETWFGQVGTVLTLSTLLGGILVVAVRWWWWRTQEFLVTNRRLVLAWGVLNKSSSDSSLEKINDAQLEISLLGRLLDYGTLKVMTAAPMAGSDYLDRLWRAKEFKKVMMTAKHQLETGGLGADIAMPRPVAPAGTAAVASTPVMASAAPGIDVSGGADPLRADTPEEVTAVLAQLSKLHDEGHLTDADYEAKKQELLGRL
jgi:hypothetical protein